MTLWIKNMVVAVSHPWRGPLLVLQYGHRRSNTCFWTFAIYLRVFWRGAICNRIYFDNPRRDYRRLTGLKMPFNLKSNPR